MATVRDRRKLGIKVALDLGCIVAVAIPIGLFNWIGVPYHRGFFCDDESLKHPYLSNTIPTWLLGVVGICLPILAVLIVEAFHEKKNNCLGIVSVDPNEHTISYFEKCYKIIIIFIFGGGVTQLLTEIGKYSIGRLRPHFFSMCKLDMSTIDCSKGYITDFTCSGDNAYLLKDMRLSFPSGHASIALYTMVFFMAYLQGRLTTPRTNLIRPVLQIVAFSLAFFTCLSRISDYKHHWSDVLAGGILGTLVAICVITFLCSFHLERSTLPKYFHSSNGGYALRSSRRNSMSTPTDSTAEILDGLSQVVSYDK